MYSSIVYFFLTFGRMELKSMNLVYPNFLSKLTESKRVHSIYENKLYIYLFLNLF